MYKSQFKWLMTGFVVQGHMLSDISFVLYYYVHLIVEISIPSQHPFWLYSTKPTHTS